VVPLAFSVHSAASFWKNARFFSLRHGVGSGGPREPTQQRFKRTSSDMLVESRSTTIRLPLKGDNISKSRPLTLYRSMNGSFDELEADDGMERKEKK
jgi:hypothetical protein